MIRLLAIDYDREGDGRWIADVAALPGVMTYGRTRAEATAKVEALTLRVIDDRRRHGEHAPQELLDWSRPPSADDPSPRGHS